MNTKNDILKIHFDNFLTDLHCDTLMSFPKPIDILNGRESYQTDIPRFIEGGYQCVVMAMYVSPKDGSRMEDNLKRMCDIFFETLNIASDKIGLVKSYPDLIDNQKNNKLSVILGIEGFHPLGNSLKKIEEYYNKGVRVFTLTWNNQNMFADSCQDSVLCGSDYGLTELGKHSIKLINELGGIIDLAHSSKKTFMDTIELSSSSPIVSHTGIHWMRDMYRNIDDEQIIALGKKKGITTIFFIPEYLNPDGKENISLEKIVEGYNHIIELAGIDCVAIGTDFDGTGHLPDGIAGPQDLWKLTEAFINFGYTEFEIGKILGNNFLRILREICP